MSKNETTKYALLSDGRVSITFMQGEQEFKNSNGEVIGESTFKQIVTLKDKKATVAHLKEEIAKGENNLVNVQAEYDKNKLTDDEIAIFKGFGEHAERVGDKISPKKYTKLNQLVQRWMQMKGLEMQVNKVKDNLTQMKKQLEEVEKL